MPTMNPDILWAPWRLAYVQGDPTTRPKPLKPASWRAGADRRCFLCRAASAAPEHDRELGVVARTDASLVVINRFPYANGHLLVAPLDHRATLADLDRTMLLDLQELLVAWCRRIEARMEAQGFNIGLNVGAVAGAGVPGHLHWHVVPRWPGDVNFMPSVAGVKVLPQALDALWHQLRGEDQPLR
jgi:ATP adenylyltransferase